MPVARPLTLRAALLIAGPGLSLLLPATAAAAAELQLKRVMLSTGGVGYYEYEARVEGTEQVRLDLRLDQMDDVLKSLVVFDDKGGGGRVEMPSRAPLIEIFRNLPIGPDAFATTQGLLAALKGAEVEVDGPVSATGRVLSVTPETLQRETATMTRHRVALMTQYGIVQFVLEEAETVQFKDPVLKGQIEQALAALARHRERDGRSLTITAQGEGARSLTVAFVVEAPLWKTSYRLSSADGRDTARMQGWAIIENASGQDWRDVELTLVSGNPVTFRQALYSAYYVSRPEIPVEVLGRILPNVDEGEMDVLGGGTAGRDSRLDAAGGALLAAPPPPPVPMAAAEDMMATMPYDASQTLVTGNRIAAETTEAATQVVFRIPGTVSVGNGQSLAVPIIDKDVPGARIALYQPQTHRRHPLAALRLTNDTGTGIPTGAVTLFEALAGGTAYVGDARLGTLPAGDTRYLSFALDQKTLIDSAQTREQTLTKATLAKGLMTLSVVDREITVYTLKAPANEARAVVIEHPREPGWAIVTPASEGIEMTDTAFRVPFALEAGQTAELRIVTELPREERITLVDLGFDYLEANMTNQQLTEPQRQAFAKMRDMRAKIDEAQARITRTSAERERIFKEQERIRENLRAVPPGSDLANRYLAELTAQEDQLAQLAIALRDAERARQVARDELANFVGELAL